MAESEWERKQDWGELAVGNKKICIKFINSKHLQLAILR